MSGTSAMTRRRAGFDRLRVFAQFHDGVVAELAAHEEERYGGLFSYDDG